MPSSLPKAVPTGTDDYYQQRLADFTARNPDVAPPSYYADFGDKCLHQFRKTEPYLTVEGQRWLQRTLVDLQERMENRRAANPVDFDRLEHDSDAFEKAAFEMHSDAYLESGLSSLPLSDLIKIARTPDVGDVITPEGLKEIFQVISGLATEDKRGAPRRFVQSVLRTLNRWRSRWLHESGG